VGVVCTDPLLGSNVSIIISLPSLLFLLSTSLPSSTLRSWFILTMPFVYPAPSPPRPSSVSNTASLPPPHPESSNSPIITTIKSMTSSPSSLPPILESGQSRTTLQTVSQRMVEISKERAAKRKREREARQRGCSGSGSGIGTGNGGGSWSGDILGDESIVSSAESSLESRRFDQPPLTWNGITNITSTDDTVEVEIPNHQSSTQAVRRTNPAITSAHAQRRDLLHPQLRAHIPTPGRRTAVDTSGPNTTRGNSGSSLSTPLSAGLLSTQAEEMDVDDDADLKKLMNQAENMLKIVDTPIAVGFGLQSAQSQSQSRSQIKSRSASQAYVEDYGTSTGTASQGLGGMVTGMGAEVVDGRK